MSECMGRRCENEAQFEVRGLDPSAAVSDYPVRLCRSCLGTDPGVVDFFRWSELSRAVAGDRP